MSEADISALKLEIHDLRLQIVGLRQELNTLYLCVDVLRTKTRTVCQTCSGTGKVYRPAHADYKTCEACEGKGQ